MRVSLSFGPLCAFHMHLFGMGKARNRPHTNDCTPEKIISALDFWGFEPNYSPLEASALPTTTTVTPQELEEEEVYYNR